MIEYREHITRDTLRAEPNVLFVFGDNMDRRGMGGQAAEMRGEPNAVGIPTKWSPSMRPGAFLTDADMPRWLRETVPEFVRLLLHQSKIVWPRAGIGTGMARLEENAPAIHQVLEALRVELGRQL